MSPSKRLFVQRVRASWRAWSGRVPSDDGRCVECPSADAGRHLAAFQRDPTRCQVNRAQSGQMMIIPTRRPHMIALRAGSGKLGFLYQVQRTSQTAVFASTPRFEWSGSRVPPRSRSGSPRRARPGARRSGSAARGDPSQPGESDPEPPGSSGRCTAPHHTRIFQARRRQGDVL